MASDQRDDLKQFWQRFQRGIEVGVDGMGSDRLLGVRDGFLRYFHDGMDRPLPVAVVPQEGDGAEAQGMAASDQEAIERATERARGLRARLRGEYQFYVSCEPALATVATDDHPLALVRLWTAVVSPIGESWGSGGSLALPRDLSRSDGLHSGWSGGWPVPGTRRGGGLFHAVTGGLETRRQSVALSTLLALSSLLYGVLESPGPLRRR